MKYIVVRIRCDNFRQFCRMCEWAAYLNLEFERGNILGELVAYQPF